ncbi:hypothetical protein AB0D68_10815 [Streptomyces sp. NPDC048212]|uniref:hypothetical protein n=1 Tax=Streptomyces sp. NPDC048212 TaxID=3156658 RepID=UPI0034051933
MKFTLEVTGMGNAAFTEEYGGPEMEMARILRAAAEKVEDGFLDAGSLFDLNGNKVGQWRVTES